MELFRKVLARLGGANAPDTPVQSPAVPIAPPSPADPVAVARADQLVTQGNQLEDAGQLAAAMALYDEAVRIAPQLPRAHLNLGLALAAGGEPARAVEAYRAGLALAPAHPYLHYNLAHALYRQGDFMGARAHADAALAAQAAFPQALVLLSNALDELGMRAPALEALERAQALQPDMPGLQRNRVRLLMELLRLDDAMAAAREGLRAFPGDAELHWLLAITALLRGDFEVGWPEHEWRSEVAGGQPLPDFGRPRWDGKQDLRGRSILLFAEQGFGDAIQFLRFVPVVAQRAGRVVLRVHPGLGRLARSCAPGNCVVIELGESVPDTDFQCPLLSLALALGLGQDAFGGSVPYLLADPARVSEWHGRLQEDGAPCHVGVVWSGNPSHVNDRNRSVPLATFAALASAGCGFVSLQPQVRESDREAAREWRDLRHLGLGLQDFAETAALVSALDLVVTVDTSVAHLAGALGKPVWILLPSVPDWRWMLAREDSPWYPTARLYRQGPERSWDSVLERVGRDLRAFLPGSSTAAAARRFSA